MTEKTTQSVANLGYHAHIYYDPAKTRAATSRTSRSCEAEISTVVFRGPSKTA
jgi:aromatic ring-cleaving dioxygenase